MKILKTLKDLNAYREGVTMPLAFVPTMGALHEGHLELVRQALQRSDEVIASIFVNPTQFAPHEDLDSYPRTIEDDCKKLEALGCKAAWLPSVEDLYPGGEVKADIDPGEIGLPLEGEFRPHFFGGVATVVKRLFDHVKPDIAFFGEKDYQQLQVIKRLVETQNMPIEIVGVPLVRDNNGLALSSRNAYLKPEEYDIACHLNRVLFSMAEKIKTGADISDTESWGVEQLKEAGFDAIQYCTVRDAVTLLPSNQEPLRVFAATVVGKTRLIDNVPV